MEKRITAIYAQKKNPDRVNIDLDGEFAFGLARITAAWLNVGDVLSEQKIAVLTSEDSTEVAYQKALRLLDYRARTEKEIQQRLEKIGFEHTEINQVVIRLRNAGLVQDEQYATLWVENRNHTHPRSQRMMRYELKNKGISEDIIEKALSESMEDAELATRAATRYAQRLSNLDRLAFRNKLSAFLSRRGFSYGTIAPVVQSIWNSMNSGDANTLENEE